MSSQTGVLTQSDVLSTGHSWYPAGVCHLIFISQTGVLTQSDVLSTGHSWYPAGVATWYSSPRLVFWHRVMFCPQVIPDILQELPPDIHLPDRCSYSEWCFVHRSFLISCRSCQLIFMSQTGVPTKSDVLSTGHSWYPAGVASWYSCPRQVFLLRVMFCPQVIPDILQELPADIHVPDRCSY